MSDGRKPQRPILAVSFRFRDADFVVKAMDELDLETVCAAICGGETASIVGAPEVIFLETLRKTADGEGKYIRQVGGSCNYGHVKVRLEPKGLSEGFEFLNTVPETLLPGEYAAAAEASIREAALSGVLNGYKIVDVQATLFDGSYHPTDSNPMAFQIAGSMAFKEAAKKAHPVLLEPVMQVEAVVPETSQWMFLEDLGARQGRIESVTRRGYSTAIRAIVPLRNTLRSSPFGRLEYSMQFAGYEPVSGAPDERGDHGPGVTANKPTRPGTLSGAAAASLYFESE